MKFGILSDIHEDRQNLLKAARILEKSGCHELICLGDIVGYGQPYYNYEKERDAAFCLSWVVDNCKFILPGNHDFFAAERIPKNSPGFIYPPNWYELDLQTRIEKSAGQVWLYEPEELPNNLEEVHKNKIGSLPEMMRFSQNKWSFLLSHYLYPDLTGSGKILPPNKELINKHLHYLRQQSSDIGIFGHCHPEGILNCSASGAKLIPFNRPVSIRKQTCYGVPCVANGRNTPGVSILNLQRSTIKSKPLRSFFKRL